MSIKGFEVGGVQAKYDYESLDNIPANLVQDANYVHTDNNYTNADKTKLSGIEAQANKTTIDATLTQSGQAADAKATGDAISALNAQVIASMPHDTASGSIASFPDGAAMPVIDCSVAVAPNQDLNGYDNPWPAGGGKNKFDISKMGERAGVTVSNNTFIGTARSFTADSYVESFTAPTGSVLTVSCTAKSNGVVTSGAGFAITFVYDDNTTLRPWYTNNSETTDTYHTGTVTATRDIIGYSFVDYNNGTDNTWTVKDFQIEFGSTATSWTPYSNICPISGWTECKVTRTGKNLCYDTLNGLVSVGVVDSFYYNNNDCRSLVFQCKQGETYIASGGTFNRCSLGIFDALPTTGTKAKSVVNGTAGQPITANADGVGVLYVSNAPVDVSTAQIELGSTASAYEPYQGQTYTIDLDGTRYGGTLDVTSGKLTVDRAMVDMGTLNYTYDSSGRFYTSINGKKNEASDQDMMLAISSMYMPMTATTFQNTPTNGTMRGATTGGYVYFRNDAYTDAATFKTAMSGVQLVYELATPIEVDLTPTQITTLSGANNIWADTGDIILLEYMA